MTADPVIPWDSTSANLDELPAKLRRIAGTTGANLEFLVWEKKGYQCAGVRVDGKVGQRQWRSLGVTLAILHAVGKTKCHAWLSLCSVGWATASTLFLIGSAQDATAGTMSLTLL